MQHDNYNKKYSVIVHGKFSAFKISEELHNQKKLNKLVTSYPRFKSPTCLKPHLSNLGFLYIWLRVGHRIFKRGGLHDQFIKHVFSLYCFLRYLLIDDGSDVYIFVAGNGYYKSLIRLLKRRQRKIVFTYGSAHPAHRNELMKRLSCDSNISRRLNIVSKNIIEYYDWELEVADLCVAASMFVARSLEKYGKLSNSKILCSHYGANLIGNPIVKSDIRYNSLVIVGVVSYQKGLHYILEAAKKCPNVHFTFVGEIEHSSKISGASKNVQFKGRMAAHEILPELSRHDALLIASVQDGFAAVVLQGMAAGLSILTSENVGAAELCDSSIDVIFKPFSDLEIVTAIDTFYDGYLARQEKARRRQRNITGLTWQKFVNDITNQIES